MTPTEHYDFCRVLENKIAQLTEAAMHPLKDHDARQQLCIRVFTIKEVLSLSKGEITDLS